MQDGRGMLQLAGLADDGRLAVALGLTGRDAQRGDALLAQQCAELFADGDQLIQVLAVASGIRVGNDRDGDSATGRRVDGLAHFDAGLVDLHDEFSDVHAHAFSCVVVTVHLKPSHFAMFSARRPPTRSWIR